MNKQADSPSKEETPEEKAAIRKENWKSLKWVIISLAILAAYIWYEKSKM